MKETTKQRYINKYGMKELRRMAAYSRLFSDTVIPPRYRIAQNIIEENSDICYTIHGEFGQTAKLHVKGCEKAKIVHSIDRLNPDQHLYELKKVYHHKVIRCSCAKNRVAWLRKVR